MRQDHVVLLLVGVPDVDVKAVVVVGVVLDVDVAAVVVVVGVSDVDVAAVAAVAEDVEAANGVEVGVGAVDNVR